MFKRLKIWQAFLLEDIMKIWDDEEVKFLFREVENKKAEQKALKEAFVLHAKKYNRKPDSVRNYYYHEVENLKSDKIRRERLCIDIDKHNKNVFCCFNEMEESSLMTKIENLVKAGMSVRAACHKLGGGDLTLMTRLQNKYQNMKRKTHLIKFDNVIPFKKKQKCLTESEINSLFFGLVKLIKKSVTEELVEKGENEKRTATILLRKSFDDLQKKDEELQLLKKELKLLKLQNCRLSEKINVKQCDKNNLIKQHLANCKIEAPLKNKV